MIAKIMFLSEMYEAEGVKYQEWLSSDGEVTISIGKNAIGVTVKVYKKLDGQWPEIGSTDIKDLTIPEEELFSKALELGKQIAGREDFEMKEQEDTTSGDIAATPGRIPASDAEDWWKHHPKGNVSPPKLPEGV